MIKMKPVVEGYVKYRDGKKWKRRYCVLCSSPTSQYMLHLYLGKSYDDFAAHRSSGNVQRPMQGSDEIAVAAASSLAKAGGVFGGSNRGSSGVGASGGVAPPSGGINSAASSASSSSAGSGGGSGGSGYTANPVTEQCNKTEAASQRDFVQAVQTARSLNAPAPYDIITGFESGCHQDRESHVLLLVGRATVHAIAHQTMDDMFTWAETLERHMKDSSYHVTLCRIGGDGGCKLSVGLQASLHVQQWRVCLVGEPSAGCKFICQWRLDAIDTMYTMEPPPGTAALAGGSGGITGGGGSGGGCPTAAGLAVTGPASSSSSSLGGGAPDGLSGPGLVGSLGLSTSTSSSTLLDCRGRVEDLLVLKTNKNAGKVQGNFTFQVDSHRLPQLTKAIEELMLRRFPTLASEATVTTTGSSALAPSVDNLLAAGLAHSASTASYGMDISFRTAPHRTAAAGAAAGATGGGGGGSFSSLSQGASAENGSPPPMMMAMGGGVGCRPNQTCSPLSSSFPREGSLIRSAAAAAAEAHRYVNIASSNRSFTGLPSHQGEGKDGKRHQFSFLSKTHGMERSDEIVIPQSRLHGLESCTSAAVPEESSLGNKDRHRQVSHRSHQQQQQQQQQNGKNLNVPFGSTGSDTGSTRSETSASSSSCLAVRQQQKPTPAAVASQAAPAPQSNHVFPSVKVFAGVITSLTPAPSTVASSAASLASHISDAPSAAAPARVQSGGRGTPPYRGGTSGSLRGKAAAAGSVAATAAANTPFNSPPRPLLATAADPYNGPPPPPASSHQQQTSPPLRKISTVSMPKMMMMMPGGPQPTSAAVAAVETTNPPAAALVPPPLPGTVHCERCHAVLASASAARQQHTYRGQWHKCRKAANRRPRSADPALLPVASTSSVPPRGGGGGREQPPPPPPPPSSSGGGGHFHQDVFTVDEDVSAVLPAGKASAPPPSPPAKHTSTNSDTGSLSLSHRIGQIFQSLYSGLSGSSGAGKGGGGGSRPPLDGGGGTSAGDESPRLRNSVSSSTGREDAKPPRPLLPSSDTTKWGVSPRASALVHSSSPQDPSRRQCCDGPAHPSPPPSFPGYSLRPHAFVVTPNRSQVLRRSRTFDDCEMRRRRARRRRLLDCLVSASDSSNQTTADEAEEDVLLPTATTLIPASSSSSSSSDCLFFLVPNVPSTGKNGDDSGGNRWRSRRFLIHQSGACCSCHCSWQRAAPTVSAPPAPPPPQSSPPSVERLTGCCSSPSTRSNWGGSSHLALTDSSPCLRTSKFRVWRLLPEHKLRNVAPLITTADSTATSKPGLLTGIGPSRHAAVEPRSSTGRSPQDKVSSPSLTRHRPPQQQHSSYSVWSILSLSSSEWAETVSPPSLLHFDTPVASNVIGGSGGSGGSATLSYHRRHPRRLSQSCLFESTTPTDQPSLSPPCCCSPVSASSLSLCSHEGEAVAAYLSGASKHLPPAVFSSTFSDSATRRGHTTSFCDLCGSSAVVPGADSAASQQQLHQHRKRSVSHSERDYMLLRQQAVMNANRLNKTSGGSGVGVSGGIQCHEYANFEVCARANTLPHNSKQQHGQRASNNRQAASRGGGQQHDLPSADRPQARSGDVCDGGSSAPFSHTEGVDFKSPAIRSVAASTSHQSPSVASLSSSAASHTSSPSSPPLAYCNLPNTLLAISSNTSCGSISSSNSYFYQQQQAAAERAALSDAMASYANWPMLLGRRGPSSSSTSGRYGTLSGSPPLATAAAPLLPLMANSAREPSDGSLRSTGEASGLRRSYCGPPCLTRNLTAGVSSETSTNSCVVPDEVRDPKRNYALVDLRPSPASSVLTPTDITINPSCAGSRASNFSAAAGGSGSIAADVRLSSRAGGIATGEEPLSEPDSSASTLMGFSTTTSSSTLLQQQQQRTQHSGTAAATDACDGVGLGATNFMDSKQSHLSVGGCSTRSGGIYRRRHSHSLSSALPEPPLNYVHVITMPRRTGGEQNVQPAARQYAPGRPECVSADSLPPRCGAPRESWAEESSSGLGAETILSDHHHHHLPPPPVGASEAPLAAAAAEVGAAAPHLRTPDVAYAQIDFVRTRALSAVNGNLESLLSSASERQAAAAAGGAGGSGTVPKAGRSAFGLKSVSRSKRIINRGSRKKSNVCPGGEP